MKKLSLLVLVLALVTLLFMFTSCAAEETATVVDEGPSYLEIIQLELENNNMPAVVELVLSIILLPLLIAVALLGIVVLIVFLIVKYIGVFLFFI